MNRYTFDVKAFVTVYITAASEEEARKLLRDSEPSSVGSTTSTTDWSHFAVDGEADLIDEEDLADE